jgi:hypothetical protein
VSGAPGVRSPRCQEPPVSGAPGVRSPRCQEPPVSGAPGVRSAVFKRGSGYRDCSGGPLGEPERMLIGNCKEASCVTEAVLSRARCWRARRLPPRSVF